MAEKDKDEGGKDRGGSAERKGERPRIPTQPVNKEKRGDGSSNGSKGNKGSGRKRKK